MSLTVTSAFRAKIDSTNPSSMVQKFTFANSDLSTRVINYPVISRDSSEVVGGTVTFDVENASQDFNSFETDRTQFFQAGVYEFGFDGLDLQSIDARSHVTNGLVGDLSNVEFREAQNFLVSSDSIPVSFEFFIRGISGSPSGNINLRIETNTSSGPSGTLANPSALIAFSSPVSGINVGSFSTDFTLTPNSYHFVLECDSQATDNHWLIGYLTTNQYIFGSRWLSNDGGATFTNKTPHDLYFKFDHEVAETLQIFGGRLIRTPFRENRLSLTFEDKLAQLKDKAIFNTDSVDLGISFTGSNYNPADIAWWVVTSFGGLSAVKSTSNVDINFQSWSDWFNVFDGDSIVVNANFDGENIVDILDDIRVITDSTIYAEGDNKLYFNRWSGASSFDLTVTDSFTSGDISMTIDGNAILNTISVPTSFNVGSGTWASIITEVNTASVNSYGVFEHSFKDIKTVWYVDESSAINHAQRLAFRRSQPNATIKARTSLKYADVQLGDEISFTTDVYSLDDRSLNLKGYEIDIDNGKIELEMDEGFGRGGGRLHGFILDDSHWGLLDASDNPLL